MFEGHVYIFSRDGGIVTCLDAESGEEAYRRRLPGAGQIWASPLAGNGKVYCLDADGTTFVLRAGPEFELLAQNKLEGMFWSSPAASNDDVFLRSVDHLYCISNVD